MIYIMSCKKDSWWDETFSYEDGLYSIFSPRASILVLASCNAQVWMLHTQFEILLGNTTIEDNQTYLVSGL